MSQRFVAVQWTRRKLVYDLVLVVGLAGYLGAFLAAHHVFLDAASRPSWPILMMRATGSGAFLLLTLILALGPLSRLDRRFLVLVHNRRHAGVLCALLASWHAKEVLGYYLAFGPHPSIEALFLYDASFRAATVPFQWFGALALLVLVAMAATSHDFWQKLLGPVAWKGLHMAVYPAYGLVVAHVVLGALRGRSDPGLSALVGSSVALLSGLHLVTALGERRRDRPARTRTIDGVAWLDAGPSGQFEADVPRGVVAPGGERLAVVLGEEGFSALHGVCAHQGGPLAEGRVIDGCLTCPWHGWQYRPMDGRAPPPFTERLPTHAVRLAPDGHVLVDPRPCAPGTPLPPAPRSPESG